MIKQLIFTIIAALFLVSPILPGHAMQPDIVTDMTNQPIAQDQKLFYVYFHYGDPVIGKDINDKSISLKIDGNEFKVNRNNVFDLHNENGSIIACNETYNGKEYQVSPNMVNDSGISFYGPRTQNQEQSILAKNYTGCLKVGLERTSSKSANKINDIVFDEDARNSESYKDEEKPGRQILQLSVGEEISCKNTETFLNGACIDKCPNGNPLNKNGECLDVGSGCQVGEEMVDGSCLPVCETERDQNGECFDIVIERSNNIVNIILNGLIVVVIGYILFIINDHFKFVKFNKK